MSQPGPWRFSFQGYGECLPSHSNYAELDKERVDAWGIPVLKIHCVWSKNEMAIQKDMSIAAAEMLAAAGARESSLTPTIIRRVFRFMRWVRRGWDATQRRQSLTLTTRHMT